MKFAILLGAIPVAVWVIAGPSRPPPQTKTGKNITENITAQPTVNAAILAKPVATEGIREQRMDADTFRLRWRAAIDLPPATVIREVPIAEVAVSPPRQFPERRFVQPRPVRVAQVTDICTRHKMRKVWQGKSWRCRR